MLNIESLSLRLLHHYIVHKWCRARAQPDRVHIEAGHAPPTPTSPLSASGSQPKAETLKRGSVPKRGHHGR
jgi:hypothetical protein